MIKIRKLEFLQGAYAVNPVNDEEIPIWVADYVLAGYGTGAIMAVPMHDERDFDFAVQMQLPVRTVVAPLDGKVPEGREYVYDGQTYVCFPQLGKAVNSGPLDGIENG